MKMMRMSNDTCHLSLINDNDKNNRCYSQTSKALIVCFANAILSGNGVHFYLYDKCHVPDVEKAIF